VKRVFVFFVLLGLLSTAMGAVGQAVPTFVGIRTFLGAPYVTKLEDLHADFAVLGVPFDEGTWGQPGERYGPRDLRESSQEYNHDLTQGFYYIDGDHTVLKGKHWADVGDIEIFPTVAARKQATRSPAPSARSSPKRPSPSCSAETTASRSPCCAPMTFL